MSLQFITIPFKLVLRWWLTTSSGVFAGTIAATSTSFVVSTFIVGSTPGSTTGIFRYHVDMAIFEFVGNAGCEIGRIK